MHSSAWQTGKRFFQKYVANIRKSLTVVEIGSIAGSLRDHRTSNVIDYVGINSTPGPGVDIVLYPGHPYYYPLFDTTVDVVVTSSRFENAEIFYRGYMEAMRILKLDGILFCNMPVNQIIPTANNELCPITPKGLELWANLNNVPSLLLESTQSSDEYYAVFIKNKTYDYCYRMRIFEN